MPGGKLAATRQGLVDLAAGDDRLAAVGQRVDHHRRGAEHIHHHRHPTRQAPRRDQARQQVHEHPGPFGRALLRSRRHASLPTISPRGHVRLWHMHPDLGELPRRRSPRPGRRRRRGPDDRPQPPAHLTLGAADTFAFPPPPFSDTLPAGSEEGRRRGPPVLTSRCMDARAEGRYLPIAGPRRFIGDLVHFAHRIPSAPVSRTMDVCRPGRATRSGIPRGRRGPALHEGVCAGRGGASPAPPIVPRVPLAAALRAPLDELRPGDRAVVPGRAGVFVGLFRAPEQQTIAQLQDAVEWYKNQPLEKVGVYRLALRFSRVPRPIRADVLVEHAERLGVQARPSGSARSA